MADTGNVAQRKSPDTPTHSTHTHVRKSDSDKHSELTHIDKIDMFWGGKKGPNFLPGGAAGAMDTREKDRAIARRQAKRGLGGLHIHARETLYAWNSGVDSFNFAR